MTNRIRRYHRGLRHTDVTTDVATTTEIDLAEVAGGAVLIPLSESIALLTYYGAREVGGNYLALSDAQGEPVTQTVQAGQGYPLPDACFGYGAIRIVSDVDGTLELSLKG